MKSVKARVENGRLHLDEPTDLPDGAEVELVPRSELDESDRETAARSDERPPLVPCIEFSHED